MINVLRHSSFPGSNVYFINSEKPVIIDTGHSQSRNSILGISDKFNVKLISAEKILLTHSHPDHTGAAAALKLHTGASLCGFKPEVNKKLTGSLKEELNLLVQPFMLDLNIENDSIIDLGNDFIQSVHTPGHADDHMCYYLKSEKILFTGDLITDSDIGYLNPNRHFSESLRQLEHSIQLCQNLKPDVLFPGHGNAIPVTDALWRKIFRKIWLFKKNPSLLIPHTLIATLIFYLATKSPVNYLECEDFIVSNSHLFEGFIENTTKDLIRSEFSKLIAVLLLKEIIIKEGDMISLNNLWTRTESLWIA